MSLFRRAVGWLFVLAGVILGLLGSGAIIILRRLIRPPRQRLWATPADLGLAYEDVAFTAKDGVELSGWFVPAPQQGMRRSATILIIHGWSWNRLGNAADDRLSGLIGDEPVDLLRLANTLHGEGYHLLMFDLRNHGQSGSAPPVTFGWRESEDVMAAITYLQDRPDAAAGRIGAVGLATGANALLFALPKTTAIHAAVAVQPATISHSSKRAGADLMGPFGRSVLALVELLYRAFRGPSFASLVPGAAAANAGNTPILFVQGDGDPWGSPSDVTEMALAFPHAHGPLLVASTNRSGAHRYVVDHPGLLTRFFDQHLPA